MRGNLLSSYIAQNSGSPALDAEALAMLARAQPIRNVTIRGPLWSRRFAVP